MGTFKLRANAPRLLPVNNDGCVLEGSEERRLTTVGTGLGNPQALPVGCLIGSAMAPQLHTQTRTHTKPRLANKTLTCKSNQSLTSTSFSIEYLSESTFAVCRYGAFSFGVKLFPSRCVVCRLFAGR